MSTLEAQARAWAAANPTRDGSNWNGWCASQTYRFTKATTAYDPATAAYRASSIVSTDASLAPIGAIHFWLDGGDGHVGVEVRGRGRGVFMASRHVTEVLAPSLGIVSVGDYNARAVGLRYAGWSRQYGANPVRMAADDLGQMGDAPAPSAPASSGSVGPIIRSGADWAYRRPSGELAKRVVRALIARGRLARDYPNDGAPGVEFDKGVQRTLSASGVFASKIDGIVERGGSYGVQDYGKRFGSYAGRRDGRPEVLSWEAFALGLERP